MRRPGHGLTRLFDRLTAESVQEWIPLRAVFELTFDCCLSCPFCYRVRKTVSELTTDEAGRLIRELRSQGCMFITFTGGEPLCRNDFWELGRLARSEGLAIELKTNGFLVDDEAADRIAELLPLNVDISLYGSNAAVHDQMTRVTGSFGAAIAAVRLLSERGVRVTLKSLLTRRNFDEHSAIRDLARDMGVDVMFDLTVTARQDGSGTARSLRLTDQQLAAFLSSHKEDYGGSLAGNVGKHLEALADDCAGCLAGVNTCCISPYGDVYPCVQFAVAAGNVRKKPFGEIWNQAQVLRKLRRTGIEYLKECRECDLRQYCVRCPGLAEFEDGDWLGRSSEACRFARICRDVINGAGETSCWGAEETRGEETLS